MLYNPIMIRGLILDIDGVLVGSKPGYNFPAPHRDVIQTLKYLNGKGLSVSFCTAKPGFSIAGLVKEVGLDTVHISSGGSEIINHIQNKIAETHPLENNSAVTFVNESVKRHLYTEAYTSRGYAIENGAFCKLTEINISILDAKPEKVPSLAEFANRNEIIKIMPAAFDHTQKKQIEDMMPDFPDLQLQFGANPMYAPTLFAVVTQKGITKQSGGKAISKYTGIPLTDILGVGDGVSDWEFMQLCTYTATVDNADRRVKQLVTSRGKNGYIGASVDHNGILDVFRHYHLLG
jgi:HAD superfamily hydrolase (TIGR01484 family)